MSMCNHHFLKDISFNIWRKWKSPPIWAILIHCAQKPLIWYKLLTFYENNLEVTFFFLEVLILPSIIIFKHFPLKKNQCAQLKVCWFHLCTKTSFDILSFTQNLKFECKIANIHSLPAQLFLFEVFLSLSYQKNIWNQCKIKLSRFLQRCFYKGLQWIKKTIHSEFFRTPHNIKVQVPSSCVQTY